MPDCFRSKNRIRTDIAYLGRDVLEDENFASLLYGMNNKARLVMPRTT